MHTKTVDKREWEERQAPMVWMGFAVGALANGKPPADAAKAADAMCSQFAQRFVRVDDEPDQA